MKIEVGSRKVIVMTSGGSGSAVALLRVLNRFPRQQVAALFADTQTEDADLYRFLDGLEACAGIPIIRLTQGLDIWDCFEKHGVMRIKEACKASVELKQKPLDQWVSDHYSPEEAVVATGLSWMEPERQSRMEKKKKPYDVIHPLNWLKRLSNCEEKAWLGEQGLRPPDLYDKGYPHNNCGGGCVLAGQGQWAGLLADFPERFRYHEEREQAFFKRTGFTVLRDRRGGETRPMTLRELRERVGAGETFREFRSACNCMSLA